MWGIARGKFNFLLGLLARSDVAVIQDVYGDLDLRIATMAPLNHLFWWRFSLGRHRGAAGILTLVRWSVCERISTPSSLVIVEGKAMCVEFRSVDEKRSENGSLAILNLHNDHLSREEVEAVASKADALTSKSLRLGPRHLFFIGGETYLFSLGTCAITMERMPIGAQSPLSPLARRLEKAVAAMLQFSCEEFTHHNCRLKHLSEFDKLFGTVSSWLAKNLTCHM